MGVLRSQRMSIDFKGFFFLKVRKFAKMAVFVRDLFGYASPARAIGPRGRLWRCLCFRFGRTLWAHSPTASTNKKCRDIRDTFYWSEWRDLNPRHLAPQTSALPGCATFRCLIYTTKQNENQVFLL